MFFTHNKKKQILFAHLITMKGIFIYFSLFKKKIRIIFLKGTCERLYEKKINKKKTNPTWSSQYTRSHEKLNNSIFNVRIFKRTTKRRKQKNSSRIFNRHFGALYTWVGFFWSWYLSNSCFHHTTSYTIFITLKNNNKKKMIEDDRKFVMKNKKN